MFLFLKLYLAHLLGDFVLQFEELYNLKVKSFFGHVLHVVMHFLAMLLLCLPYFAYDSFMWIFIFTISVIHLFQDLLKYFLSNKYPRFKFILFVVDQLFHFLFLLTIFLFPVHKVELGLPFSFTLNWIYMENAFTLTGIAFLWTTFGGSYLMHAYRKNYQDASRDNHYITSFEMSHAIIERSIVTGIFLFAQNPFVFLATPLIGILRFISPKLKSKYDFILSFVFAAFIGILFRMWMWS